VAIAAAIALGTAQTLQIPMAFLRAQEFPMGALRSGRGQVRKSFGAALLLAIGLMITAEPVFAFEIVVTQVDKNSDGSMTYHFAVKTDPGETLVPGESKETSDFVTVYNFYGLVEGSVKSPADWVFSSEQFGRTPFLDGYPVVLPVDIPDTPNLTWTVTKPVAGGTQIDGFAATTRMSGMVQGEYTAQVTRQLPAVKGAAAGTPGAAAKGEIAAGRKLTGEAAGRPAIHVGRRTRAKWPRPGG
jgi:hypothetical protein